MLDDMKRAGRVEPISSRDIESSRLGLGMEKLDRDAFDPAPLYDSVAALGVKWIRIQSGWAKTEKKRGLYSFGWLDEIVNQLISHKLRPWMCLCYGNGLYTPEAAEYVGAVGFPPLSDIATVGWIAYIKATVAHYKGRIFDYEIWNEPDGTCWRHGANAKEYGEFACRTAEAIRSIDPEARIFVGSVYTHDLKYIDDFLSTGLYKYADALTIHEYTYDERYMLHRVSATRALLDMYNPDIKIIQGESGSQSKSGGFGALNWIEVNERQQAKQLLRHTVADLLCGVEFSSYFSCVDMVECVTGGRIGGDDLSNWGYFGLIRHKPDEADSSRRYTYKPSYYTMQVLAAALGQAETVQAPVLLTPQKSAAVDDEDLSDATLIIGAFHNAVGKLGVVYWNSTDMLKIRDYESTVSMQVVTSGTNPCLIDLMDGTVYAFSEKQYKKEDNTCTFTHIPVKDHPLLIAFDDFAPVSQSPKTFS
jgi:hypothetical protein